MREGSAPPTLVEEAAADLGRRGEALAAITEAVAIRRELVARWPDVYRDELQGSLELLHQIERG